MAAAILDRVLERGRFIHLDGPSGRTRHLNLEETLPENTKRLRISGIGGSDFSEPTSENIQGATECSTAHNVLKICALRSVSAIAPNDVPTVSALEKDLQLSQNSGVPR
jgi:hypothetical protein